MSIVDRITFGCGRLRGGIERHNSFRLLSELGTAGIARLDLAPQYGEGEAEGIVGQFCTVHGANFSICTKIGIPRESPRHLKAAIKFFARTILPSRTFHLIRKTSQATVVSTNYGSFDLSTVRESFSESLELLKCDNVDRLLLHEPPIGFHDEGIASWLEGLRKVGVIREYGAGSTRDFASMDVFGSVLQARFTADWQTIKPTANRSLTRIAHGLLRVPTPTLTHGGANLMARICKTLDVPFEKSVIPVLRLVAVAHLDPSLEFTISTNHVGRLRLMLKQIRHIELAFDCLTAEDFSSLLQTIGLLKPTHDSRVHQNRLGDVGE